MANIELLDKVLKQIEQYPDTWDQGVWRCGTSYCFAGHAAILSGWIPKGEEKELYWKLNGFESEEKARDFYAERAEREKRWLSENDVPYWGKKLDLVADLVNNTNDVVLRDDEQDTICNVATNELDLDVDTAEILFRSSNTLAEIRDMVKEIKAEGFLRYDEWD